MNGDGHERPKKKKLQISVKTLGRVSNIRLGDLNVGETERMAIITFGNEYGQQGVFKIPQRGVVLLGTYLSVEIVMREITEQEHMRRMGLIEQPDKKDLIPGVV